MKVMIQFSKRIYSLRSDYVTLRVVGMEEGYKLKQMQYNSFSPFHHILILILIPVYLLINLYQLDLSPYLMQNPLGQAPPFGQILAYDHITFWVGNAKQAASYYTSRFGFDYLAYKGLETGDRDIASHVIRNNNGITFVFCSVYNKDTSQEMNNHLVRHGDGVKDIALTVQDSRAIYQYAISHGGESVKAPYQISDENGVVVLSSIKTYGDTTHTFVQRKNYKGPFLPKYKPHHLKQKFNDVLAPIKFMKIDHVAGNQPDLQMEPVVKNYQKILGFHRFWSIDDKMMHQLYSSLRLTTVTDYHENIKMSINEPAEGQRKSQIQEYVDYYHGAGAQHIALRTDSIIQNIAAMTDRGIQFLSVPDVYYDNLRKNLQGVSFKVSEDIDTLQKYKILLDHDEKGYLLQIFTKPVEDRPTLFIEVIQRRNFQGFGAGNFKSLFIAIEEQQARRGNL